MNKKMFIIYTVFILISSCKNFAGGEDLKQNLKGKEGKEKVKKELKGIKGA
ncbi:conserved hypothetical protein (plasmid) [Borreliella finlandensis]|uniref:Lipoprotein n=1 Tax=Borreliella finlandensis TaxID=498741 RepID=A0A806CB24_9SPIR|nr:conserved hypothetical protein [Borreliella finlandensis]